MLGPTLPLQKDRFGGRTVKSSGFLDSWPCYGQNRFFGGSGGTLALTGGSGGVSGDRRTRMGHTYPLPGSMAPQGAFVSQARPLTSRLTELIAIKPPRLRTLLRTVLSFSLFFEPRPVCHQIATHIVLHITGAGRNLGNLLVTSLSRFQRYRGQEISPRVGFSQAAN